MGDCWSRLMGAGGALMVALMSQSSVAAQDSSPVATVAGPAVVTAAGASVADQGVASQSARVIISVTGFRPPHDGAVQAVVKVQKDGDRQEQEIGRFGVFRMPNSRQPTHPRRSASAFRCPRYWPVAEPSNCMCIWFRSRETEAARCWRSAALKSADRGS